MKSISVIVPIYYGEKYIADIIRQIEYCRACLEKEDHVEVLFVNDSPDAPLSMNWQSNSVDIRIIDPMHHIGIHGARLRGLKQSIGEYVLFLDQDDKISPEYFQSQLHELGESDAVVCKALNGGKEQYIEDIYFLNIPYKQFVLKAWNLIVSPGQVLIRKKSIPDAWSKNVMENNGADDWLLWICMYAAGCDFALNNKILYEHVLQDSNASSNIIDMLRSEQELIRLIYQKKILLDEDFELLLEGFFKKNIIRTRLLSDEKKKLDCLEQWIKLKEKNVNFQDYLAWSDIQRIAIYGCGVIGNFIYEELKTEIEISYFIDRNASCLQREIPVYTLEDLLPKVDAVIISLIGETEKIKKELMEKGIEKVIVLKDWLINNRSI